MEHRFENLPLVLVTGQARSGTTVLTHALAAHPEIASNLKESSIVGDIAAVLRVNLEKPGRRRDLTVTPSKLALNLRRFLLHSLFPDAADNADSSDGLLESSVPFAISTFSSLRVEDLDYITLIFPRLVIANIYRNGIEVVASRMTHSHIGPQFGFEQHCIAWSHSRDSMQWGVEKTYFVPFPHHDLFDYGQTELLFKKVLDQISIADAKPCVEFVHSNVININNSPTVQPSPKAASSNAELENRIDRWHDWSEEQRDLFRRNCGETMEYFGFEIPWHVSVASCAKVNRLSRQ